MILQGRQLNRFTKLFESLMRFCATDLEVFGARRGAPMTDRDLAKVAAAVWGEDGDRSAIDRFLEANPDRLNRTDLREVATWREGFFESFNALRDGSNVYLITGTYAFAVRGLGYELDEDFYYMPTYVETLLLPFDGIITHGPTVSYLPEELSQAEQEMMRMLLEGCKSEGSVVRTSRQFQKLAPIALELARSVREEAEASSERYGLVVGPLGPGTFEGALSGLDWEERQKAIDAHLETIEESSSARVVPLLEAKRGVPRASFREFLRDETMASLEDLARRLGVRAIPHRGKDALVRDLVRRLVIDEEMVVTSVLLCGAATAMWVRRCLEAGGRSTFAASEIKDPSDAPMSAPPVLMVYQNGDVYTAVVFKEAMPVLARIDLDELCERARAIDRAIEYVGLAADFRGAMGVFDAIDECADVLGYQDAKSLLGRLTSRSLDDVGCTVAPIDGAFYVVDKDLAELEADGYLSSHAEESVQRVLGAHVAHGVRPVAELMGTYDSVWAWVRDTAAYQALARFLDAHVPDGIDEYLFSDVAGEEILFFARHMDEKLFYSDALDVLEEIGYEPVGEELEEVRALLEGYYDATPKWQLGGWAPNEVAPDA